jgi:PAS domain S-box-containing protein
MVWSVTTLGLRHRTVEQDRRDSERIANDRLALLNTIYTSAPVGLCFVDLSLRYLSMNAALAEMLGRTPEYYIGKTIRDANPELADTIEVHYRRVIESGKPILDVEIKGVTAAGPGGHYAWLASYFPVQNPSGELLGVNVALRDITARKQAEADTLFLLDLAECIRFAANAEELTWAVAVALGEHANVTAAPSRDRYGTKSVHRSAIITAWCIVDCSYQWNRSTVLIDVGRAGQAMTISDVARDERTCACRLCRRVIRAFVAVDNGRFRRPWQALSRASGANAKSH